MAVNPFTAFVFDLFILAAVLITGYTCNFYYLAYLSRKRIEKYNLVSLGEPTITVQLPIYN